MPTALTITLTAILLAAFTATVVAVTLRHARESWVHPLILSNCLLAYFVLAPSIYLLATGRFRHVTTNSVGVLAMSLAVIYGLYLTALATYYRIDVSSVYTRVPDVTYRDITPQFLYRLGLIGFAVGVLSYLVYVFVNGGPMRLLTVTPRTAFQQVPNTGRLKLLGLTGVYGGLVTTFVAARNHVEYNRLPRQRAVILAVLAVTTLAIAVSFRARMPMLVPVVFILVYVYTSGHLTNQHLAALTAVVVTAGVSFTFIEHLLIGNAGVWMLLRSAIHTSRLEVFMVVVDSVPSSYPYQWGETYLRVLMYGIEGGPLRYGDHMNILVAGKNTKHITLSGMYAGELYLNFGVIGTLLGGVVWGAALKAATQLRTSFNGYLARGVYPLAAMSAALIFSTNTSWLVKKIGLQFVLPLVAALAAVHIYQSRQTQRPLESLR